MGCHFPGNNITVKRHGFLFAIVFLLLTPLIAHGQTTNSRTFSGTGTSITATGSSLNTNLTNASVAVTGTVSITANSAVNVAQVAGTTTDTNSGLKSAGTQRIVLATDQPQLTNALKVDGSAVTQPISGTVAISTLFALDTSVDGLEGGVGAAADAAATVGSTGSLTAKLRLLTSQLDAIQTAVQLIDNAVSRHRFPSHRSRHS